MSTRCLCCYCCSLVTKRVTDGCFTPLPGTPSPQYMKWMNDQYGLVFRYRFLCSFFDCRSHSEFIGGCRLAASLASARVEEARCDGWMDRWLVGWNDGGWMVAPCDFAVVLVYLSAFMLKLARASMSGSICYKPDKFAFRRVLTEWVCRWWLMYKSVCCCGRNLLPWLVVVCFGKMSTFVLERAPEWTPLAALAP